MSLGPIGVNPVCSLRKIMTRLRGTDFSTSSARFAPSFVRQRKGPKCIQIVQYTPKQEFGVQWGGSVAFVVKKSDATSWHELLHQFGPFCTVFCNATERSQMHQNSMKRYDTRVLYGNQTVPNASKEYETHQNVSLEANGVDRVRSLRKIRDATSWH